MSDAIISAELDAEFEAMRAINEALRKLPVDGQARALLWAADKFHVTLPAGDSHA